MQPITNLIVLFVKKFYSDCIVVRRMHMSRLYRVIIVELIIRILVKCFYSYCIVGRIYRVQLYYYYFVYNINKFL